MNIPDYTPTDAAAPAGVVVIERASTPLEVGPKLNQTAADVVRFLMQQGEMVTATQSLTDDMIELFAAEVSAEIRLVDPGEEQENELLKLLEADIDAEEPQEDYPRPASGDHRHGPCGPRQDQAARPDPQRQCGRRRGGRHHPAHWRLSGGKRWADADLHRHTWPRSVHGDAGPGCRCHRHRGFGGSRRRWSDAPDFGGHQPRPRPPMCPSWSRSTRSIATTPIPIGPSNSSPNTNWCPNSGVAKP